MTLFYIAATLLLFVVLQLIVECLCFAKNWHINLQNEFRVFQSNVDVNQKYVFRFREMILVFFCLLCMSASRGTWQLSFDKRHSDPQQDSFSRTSSCSNRAESTLTSLRIICVMHRYGGQKFFFVLFCLYSSIKHQSNATFMAFCDILISSSSLEEKKYFFCWYHMSFFNERSLWNSFP